MGLLRWIASWFAVAIIHSMVFPSIVHSHPIKIDFSSCRPAVYPGFEIPGGSPRWTIQCCPVKPARPIVDGVPAPSTRFLRVRQASQCADAEYAAKLKRAYALMRALPDDDPRSLTQQWYVHCSYCGGSFVTRPSKSNITAGVDIHFGWLFYPWHRYFLFFHERILQSLLGDPTFSLTYWNWDNPYTVGDGSSKMGACLKAGHDFPAMYKDSSASTYDTNRSVNAKGNGRLHFPDLAFVAGQPAEQQPMHNASTEVLERNNLKVMNRALVSSGTTTEKFMGWPYRAGDPRRSPGGGGGTLEDTAHASVHFWTGQDASTIPVAMERSDMGELAFSVRDPVFFAHHSNMDRLFQVWKSIGPSLGQDRQYYSDPDFLNAELLFYDENKDLRRVKVGDALETEKLGYVYQQANDAAWINLNHANYE